MQAIEKIEGTKNGYKVCTECLKEQINDELKAIFKSYAKVNCIIVNPKAEFSFRFGYPFFRFSDNILTFNKKVPIDSFYINGRF